MSLQTYSMNKGEPRVLYGLIPSNYFNTVECPEFSAKEPSSQKECSLLASNRAVVSQFNLKLL